MNDRAVTHFGCVKVITGHVVTPQNSTKECIGNGHRGQKFHSLAGNYK